MNRLFMAVGFCFVLVTLGCSSPRDELLKALDFGGIVGSAPINQQVNLGYQFVNKTNKTIVGIQGVIRGTNELGKVILTERIQCTTSSSSLKTDLEGSPTGAPGVPFKINPGQVFVIIHIFDRTGGIPEMTFAATLEVIDAWKKKGQFVDFAVNEGVKIRFYPQVCAFSDGTVLKINE